MNYYQCVKLEKKKNDKLEAQHRYLLLVSFNKKQKWQFTFLVQVLYRCLLYWSIMNIEKVAVHIFSGTYTAHFLLARSTISLSPIGPFLLDETVAVAQFHS